MWQAGETQLWAGSYWLKKTTGSLVGNVSVCCILLSLWNHLRVKRIWNEELNNNIPWTCVLSKTRNRERHLLRPLLFLGKLPDLTQTNKKKPVQGNCCLLWTSQHKPTILASLLSYLLLMVCILIKDVLSETNSRRPKLRETWGGFLPPSSNVWDASSAHSTSLKGIVQQQQKACFAT